ncbi:DUF3987 domain-containing protein [Myroides odoratimimus]|uniref:DUF3987 domain-containing protein n=1 Tax=Myroides odoratimimus TaxID=76832 RepID=UPI0025791F85|nr:DUF3987 domain-containing protein [Myroides odoratimimus]MDM1448156.1 DUF3987 domain-containing protein [Myroides odoratimimus]
MEIPLKLLIEEEVYNNLPPYLKAITNRFENRERDIILLSSLGVISACLPNVQGLYDNRIVYTNLYLFIIAPPASGKGVMTWSAILAKEINLSIQQKNRESDTSKKYVSKIVPANSSSAMIYNFLQDSKDGFVIFESEADTLSNVLKQDYGNFSDLLRKAFHHEPVSISRHTDNRNYHIDSPKLSLVLSGTPNQIRELIESKENGLFSRFMYYFFDEISEWKDVSPRKDSADDLNYFFNGLAKELAELYNKLSALPKIEIVMKETHWEEFQNLFRNFDNVLIECNKSDFISSNRRLGLITYRVIMILTILRQKDVITEDNSILYADDLDVSNALAIAKILIEHSLIVYEGTKKKERGLTLQERTLLNGLPESFTRKEGLAIASSLEYPERTYDDLLKQWVDKKLIEKVKHGSYKKL